jgi:putative oxidoreductase
MKIAMIIARSLMGLIFIAASLVVLLNLVEPPPMEAGSAMDSFNKGIRAVGYFLPLLKIIELICGILFLIGRFVPLATVVIAPIIINIFAYHVFVDRTGLPVAIFLVLASCIVAYYYRDAYQPLLRAR